MRTKDLFVDKISNLPLSIIENILCLVPIKEAVRTSILSKDWRYNWTKIPKLAFSEKDMFDRSSGHDVFFNAIRQVLLLHQGPMFEFSISAEYAKAKCDEIDQIIILLARNKDTLKRLTLDLYETCDLELELPLSIYSLNQLLDLYISGFVFKDDSTFRGFDSLTTLYVQGEIRSEVSLFNLLSNCPLLEHFELEQGHRGCDCNQEISIIELFKCLPAIEHLAFDSLSIERDRVPVELPTKLVHLKYFCLNWTILIDNFGLGQLGFVIKNSPNLEKIKLEIINFSDDGTTLVAQKDFSDIWLEHLKELEIVAFAARKGEMEFVKFILAKSPILMKVRIIVGDEEVTEDKELKIVRILSGSPCASPSAEITVERRAIFFRKASVKQLLPV